MAGGPVLRAEARGASPTSVVSCDFPAATGGRRPLQGPDAHAGLGLTPGAGESSPVPWGTRGQAALAGRPRAVPELRASCHLPVVPGLRDGALGRCLQNAFSCPCCVVTAQREGSCPGRRHACCYRGCITRDKAPGPGWLPHQCDSDALPTPGTRVCLLQLLRTLFLLPSVTEPSENPAPGTAAPAEPCRRGWAVPAADLSSRQCP